MPMESTTSSNGSNRGVPRLKGMQNEPGTLRKTCTPSMSSFQCTSSEHQVVGPMHRHVLGGRPPLCVNILHYKLDELAAGNGVGQGGAGDDAALPHGHRVPVIGKGEPIAH